MKRLGFALFLVFSSVMALPTREADPVPDGERSIAMGEEVTETADMFLEKYGYYSPSQDTPEEEEEEELRQPEVDTMERHDNSQMNTNGKHSGAQRHAAVRLFQSFYHLPRTGEVDGTALRLMKQARCGNADIVNRRNSSTEDREFKSHGKRRRVKRFKITTYPDGTKNKWEVDTLTWKITRPSKQLPLARQRAVMRKAIASWSRIVPIKFVEERGNKKPAIEIWFVRGEHGTGNDGGFDGKKIGSKLAHAFMPGYDPYSIAGDMHFDEDDDWTDEETLLGTTVHELGHVMGLGHSSDTEAIMYPFYRDVSTIGMDDIRGIEDLYGSKGGQTRRPGRPNSRRSTPRPNPRPTPRYRTRNPNSRYQTTPRPDSRFRTNRPDPRYRTRRPDSRYRTTKQPDSRYRTRRPETRYRTLGPDTRYRTSRPDSRYRTARPDPRYRTRRPDSRYRTRSPYWTTPRYPRTTVQPDVSTGKIADPTAICSALARRVQAVVEDPSTKFTQTYFVFSGNQVQRVSASGAVLQTTSLQYLFPEAPEQADVIFSDPEKNSVFFIKDNGEWQYKDHQLMPGFPKMYRPGHFPERPQISFSNGKNGQGDTEVLLFGSRYWWHYAPDGAIRPEFKPISDYMRKFPSNAQFATRWKDGLVYVINRDDSYIIVDPRSNEPVQTRPVQGQPHWLMPICNHSNRLQWTSWSLTALALSLTVLFSRS